MLEIDNLETQRDYAEMFLANFEELIMDVELKRRSAETLPWPERLSCCAQPSLGMPVWYYTRVEAKKLESKNRGGKGEKETEKDLA